MSNSPKHFLILSELTEEGLYRAVSFEIDTSEDEYGGWATVDAIAESDFETAALDYVLDHIRERHPDVLIGAKCAEDDNGAVRIGNHWGIYPEFTDVASAAAELRHYRKKLL